MRIWEGEPAYDVVVAIPARSESQRIEACLVALAKQATRGLRLGVFVLCNNCEDDTAERVRRWGAKTAFDVHVREHTFPADDAHAGSARRAAMAWARSALDPLGAQILCSTDADSRVAPDWLPRLLSAFHQGADAVAGVVTFDAVEVAALDLPPLRRLEDRYAGLQARVDRLIDPRDHDPWPSHLWAWGANLTVRAAAFDRAGGVPCAPLAEDRAFAAELERVDAKLRHAPDVCVFTSARTHGRAPGGLADLVASHQAGGDLPCDAALEAIDQVHTRAELRREVRCAYENGAFDAALPRRLRLGCAEVEAALDAPFAGEAWRRLEAASPALARARLPLAALPREIARAERLVQAFTAAAAPDGNARVEIAVLWSAAPPPLEEMHRPPRPL